jgi:hypothetical protein
VSLKKKMVAHPCITESIRCNTVILCKVDVIAVEHASRQVVERERSRGSGTRGDFAGDVLKGLGCQRPSRSNIFLPIERNISETHWRTSAFPSQPSGSDTFLSSLSTYLFYLTVNFLPTSSILNIPATHLIKHTYHNSLSNPLFTSLCNEYAKLKFSTSTCTASSSLLFLYICCLRHLDSVVLEVGFIVIARAGEREGRTKRGLVREVEKWGGRGRYW